MLTDINHMVGVEPTCSRFADASLSGTCGLEAAGFEPAELYRPYGLANRCFDHSATLPYWELLDLHQRSPRASVLQTACFVYLHKLPGQLAETRTLLFGSTNRSITYMLQAVGAPVNRTLK